MIHQIVVFSTILSLSLACSNNNCLNALNHAGENAKTFCATYTKGVSTATTGLPTYAMQCTNLPSKISSACSCLATTTSSTVSPTTLSTVTSSAPGATCFPSVLVDANFAAEISGGPSTARAWRVAYNEAPGTTVLPESGFMGASTNFFEVDFPNFASDPYLTTVTLSQDNLQICDGTGTISYQYDATINAIAANPVPENNNCTITTGLTGIQSSVKSNTINWVTSVPRPSFSYSFPLTGLGKAGTMANFYVDIECTLVDWWPEIHILTPSFGTG